jgi:DNA-binding transcriptional LysR family regulator
MPFAERIITESKKAKDKMETFISADQGNIFIGAFPGSQYFGFIDLIAQFKKQFPKIKFDMYEAECSELLEMLKSLDIDVAFITELNAAEGIHFYPLVEDRLVLVVNKDHPLSGRKKISLEEVSKEPLILNEVTTLHKNAMDAFNTHGLKPNIALLCAHGQLTSLLGFVSAGLGTTLISSKVSKYYAHWEFSFLEIEPTIQRRTYLAVPETNEKRPIIQNFVQSILNNKL